VINYQEFASLQHFVVQFSLSEFLIKVMMMISSCLMRQTPRCFSTFVAGYSKLATPIPGLHIFHDFLRTDKQCKLQKKVINLQNAIVSSSTTGSLQRCKTFLSQYHNLNSDEYYRLVEVDDTSGRKIRCQYFEKYGEDGHKLSYFIGNKNLPKFFQNNLVPRVLQIPEVIAITQGEPLDWNFTFNSYATTESRPSKLAGFGFHKDIESNGEVTMIYSMGAQSEFQVRHPRNIDESLTIPLLSNSLVLLSEEARWDYEHRVVPVVVNDSISLLENEVENIRRMSLVLGFWRENL
jgi:2OG-Fe(II) oxygenase superfamily